MHMEWAIRKFHQYMLFGSPHSRDSIVATVATGCRKTTRLVTTGAGISREVLLPTIYNEFRKRKERDRGK